MIKYLTAYLLLFLILIVYGCSPATVLTSGAGSAMVVAEGDRSLGTVVDDATIKLNISAKFINSEEKLFLNIDTKVVEGRVLLTGIVDSQETRINAIKKVWEVSGVKEVINEIEVGDKTTIKEYANDLWINTQVKTLAAKELGLRSLSFNFETIKGKVYIAGVTSRPEQLNALIEVIRGIKGVKEIVNYAIIKEKE
tara:strand:- start:705 stop:1292 length:588 start_codon:yes stop_codon:yes gene_type:complete